MKRTIKVAIALLLAAGAHAQPVIRKFDASPRSIQAGGEFTLSWIVDNAKEIRIDPGVGSVRKRGSLSLRPTHDTAYSITAVGASGVRREATVTVAVVPGTGSGFTEMGLGRVMGRRLLLFLRARRSCWRQSVTSIRKGPISLLG
jgi:hypothetical protein